MPKSRVRKRTVYTPPPPKSKRRKVSPPWVGPTIVACLVIGLAWIVVYYLTSGSVAGMSALGPWNLVAGFVFIVAGVILATTWRLPGWPDYGLSSPFLTTIATAMRTMTSTVASTCHRVRFARGAYA